MKNKIYILILNFLLFISPLISQEQINPSYAQANIEASTKEILLRQVYANLYVEAIGTGFPLSLNAELSVYLNDNLYLTPRIGVSTYVYYWVIYGFGADIEFAGSVPITLSLNFGNKSAFEIGGGISLGWKQDDAPGSVKLYHIIIGYRYQRPDGIIFRIGFYPRKNFALNKICWTPGISIGGSIPLF